jgi:ABC-type transporter Mla subunit MlaD
MADTNRAPGALVPRGEYEAPTVNCQSIDEMLAEAQQATDAASDAARRLDAKIQDLQAVVSGLIEEKDELEKLLTEAETKVQKVTYVGEVLDKVQEQRDAEDHTG